ncbi:uncharacterized protein [Spinacia oleracea]|uniref:MBD domain-containing protein n=1 Tax=Spinacia oleracea TaxID=3562 RepID=A0A9R0I359_SPIOL|nr:uncharacterized protein LOC110781902 [Spinacia oleracea]
MSDLIPIETNSVKCEYKMDQIKLKETWPAWLPYAWSIHTLTDNPNIKHYSNSRGRRFFSEEEALRFLTEQSKKKVKPNKINRKIVQVNDKSEEIAPQLEGLVWQTPKWPEWLPQDWYIEQSHDNPNDQYFCSPKWRKFRSKDEVLHYLNPNSKKMMPKKPRKKRVQKA